jgi:large subunit ribosomal protein L23
MNQERVAKILLAPHITEKATMMGEKANQYVFKVAGDADKGEIKTAVESLFTVQVDSVRVLNVKGKQKRFGARMGRRKNWKKAYVKLKAGHDIDFMGAE